MKNNSVTTKEVAKISTFGILEVHLGPDGAGKLQCKSGVVFATIFHNKQESTDLPRGWYLNGDSMLAPLFPEDFSIWEQDKIAPNNYFKSKTELLNWFYPLFSRHILKLKQEIGLNMVQNAKVS